MNENKENIFGIKIGDIFYQYGLNWSCKLIYFWKITKVSEKSVWLQELEEEIVKRDVGSSIGYSINLVKPSNKIKTDEKVKRITLREGCTKNKIICPESWSSGDLLRYKDKPLESSPDYGLLR